MKQKGCWVTIPDDLQPSTILNGPDSLRLSGLGLRPSNPCKGLRIVDDE